MSYIHIHVHTTYSVALPMEGVYDTHIPYSLVDTSFVVHTWMEL